MHRMREERIPKIKFGTHTIAGVGHISPLFCKKGAKSLIDIEWIVSFFFFAK